MELLVLDCVMGLHHIVFVTPFDGSFLHVIDVWEGRFVDEFLFGELAVFLLNLDILSGLSMELLFSTSC